MYIWLVARVVVVRMHLGSADYGPINEVLRFEKPGTGCNDVPRCFSLKLAPVMPSLCRLKPSTVDGELRMKHTTEAGRPKLVENFNLYKKQSYPGAERDTAYER